MMADQRGDKELVDFHIRKAVAAAQRKGTTLTFSRFVTRLRGRNPGLNIHGSYVLDQLVRAAKDSNVVIELDRAQGD